MYDLLGILDKLHVEQAIFVGHSMGGNLHQELVFHHPERVNGMVFLGLYLEFPKTYHPGILELRIAEPIFKIYPYNALIDQSLSATATTKASQELLRSAMGKPIKR